MDFLTLAKQRFSARNYKPDSVPDEDLNYIIEAGRIAPSANNFQPWQFIVIKQKENLKEVYNLYHREWFNTAPVVIVLLADHSQSWKRANDGKDHADIDVAIAADHITLAATEKGLATCWVCNFDKQKVTDYFNLPGHLEPVVIFPLGYSFEKADTERHSIKRKSLSEIVHWERFNT